MKQITFVVAMIMVMFLSGCAVTGPYVAHPNIDPTNLATSETNYRVVRNVAGTATATYILFIGGLSEESCNQNACDEMFRNARLAKNQAIINVTSRSRNVFVLPPLYASKKFIATGTVIEFTDSDSSSTPVENVNEPESTQEKPNLLAEATKSLAEEIREPDFLAKSLKVQIDALSTNKRDSYKVDLDKELLDACKYMDRHPESIKDILPKTEELFSSYKYLIGRYYPGDTYMRGYLFLEKYITKFRSQLTK